MRHRRIGWMVVLAVLLMIGCGTAIKWYCGTYTCFERKFLRWAKDSGIIAEDIEPFFTFTFGGYQYCYHGLLYGERNAPNVWEQRRERDFDGWSVLYLEDEEEAGWILEEAFGHPVMGLECCFEGHDVVRVKKLPAQTVAMQYCFNGCSRLKKNPSIPDGVRNMAYCFADCSKLEAFEGFPERLEDMANCFDNCPMLRNCTRIPEGVKNMAGAFCLCSCLTGELQIDASPEMYDQCFLYCSGKDGAQVVLSGKAPREVLEALKETGGFGSAKNFTIKDDPAG